MRRHPDMRLTNNSWSTGDAIAAGLSFLFGVVVVVLLIAFVSQAAHIRW